MKTKLHFFMVICSIFCAHYTFSQVTQPTNAVSNANSYLGTSNNYDVVFKRMGVEAGKLTANSVSLGVGAKGQVNSTIIGSNAGHYATSSYGLNTLIGFEAGKGVSLENLNTGNQNTFIGGYAGSYNENGSNNTFIGLYSGQMNSNGSENVFVGLGAGSEWQSTKSTYIGTYSGFDYQGQGNTFLGFSTGNSGVGNNNTFLGKYSGSNSYGSQNLYIGGAGENSSGDHNICLGINAGESSTMIKSVIIGHYLSSDIIGNPTNKLIIENLESPNPLIWGDFAEDKLKFNVGSTASSGLEINGPTGQSGLQFSNLNSTSTTNPSNGKVLSLDDNGKVILVNDLTGGGGSSATNVYTIGLVGSSLSLIGATATVSNATGNYLDDVVNNAINLGYKKIYIQEGVYKLNNSIEIIGRNGITIEGSGMETILIPNTDIDIDTPLLNVSNSSYNNIIRNLSFQPHNVDETKIVNTCIRLGAACDRNLFENLYIGRKSSQNNFTYSTKPIFIDLPTGEADFNTFQNINFYRCIGGIYIKATGGIFNSNTFQNIGLHKSKVGVEFEGNGANDNVFSQIKFQTTVNNDGLSATDMTTHVFKNVNGSNNTIRDVFIADWKKEENANLQYVINTVAPPTGQPVYFGAYRTVIENVETEADGYNGKPFTFADYYQDLGTSTQFLNNAMGNRNTDYLMNNVNNVSYLGQEQNSYANNFNVEKMDKTYFSGRNNTTSFFAIEKFNNLFLGSNNVSSGAATTNTYLRGSNVYVNLGTVSPTPGQVLSSIDGGGKLSWKTAFNIYENNGWINSSTQALEGTTPSLLDNKLRTLYTQSGPYSGTDYNSTSVLFTRNGNPSFDIMYLYSGTRNAAGTALNADQSVVIGANARTIATNTNNAGYKLLVNGKVKVKDEVYILNTATHWADYVFEDDYKLKSLSEVENFINENGHLPNMPSAKEIETNGIPMAEITTKQQEKIEELTLYIIEQNKKIEALQKMKEEMDSLKKLVEKLNKN